MQAMTSMMARIPSVDHEHYLGTDSSGTDQSF
jgi:hypothetical protein